MTHLVIELPTTGIELVSGSVIEKLYNLVISGDLDASSNLLGRLSVNKTHKSRKDYLEELFEGKLFINADEYYIDFADPLVELILLLNNIGDGEGITVALAAAKVGNWDNISFKNNTSITSFDEASLFTNIRDFGGYQNYDSGKGAFRGCTSLVSIDCTNITGIGCCTFKGCTNLKYVKNLNSSVFNGTNNDTFAIFEDCSNLETFSLSNATGIGQRCFSGCTKFGGDLNMPLYNTYIPMSAFKGTAIENIVNLGSCTGLSSSDRSDWNDGCFLNCTSLKTVVLPATLNSMGNFIFRGCSNLEWIKVLATTPPTIYSRTFTIDFPSTCKFYVPDASITSYRTAQYWSDRASVIYGLSTPDIFNGTLGTVPNNFFKGTNITSADFVDSNITSVGSSAFEGCTGLTSIDLSNVTSIGDTAFYGCTSLLSIDLSSLTTIGSGVFQGCSNLTTVSLPSSITNINGSVFKSCSKLSTINLSNITNISGNAFENCHTLSNISLPSITTIGGYAFYNCTGISKVEIGPNLTTLGAYAFLTNLGVLGINPVFVFSGTTPPSSVGTNVFFGSWAHLYVPDGYESAYQTAFTDLRCTVYPVSQLPI